MQAAKSTRNNLTKIYFQKLIIADFSQNILKIKKRKNEYLMK